jgi:hypothetical protein
MKINKCIEQLRIDIYNDKNKVEDTLVLSEDTLSKQEYGDLIGLPNIEDTSYLPELLNGWMKLNNKPVDFINNINFQLIKVYLRGMGFNPEYISSNRLAFINENFSNNRMAFEFTKTHINFYDNYNFYDICEEYDYNDLKLYKLLMNIKQEKDNEINSDI